MLYISTRNKLDSYTAHRALHDYSAPDGGMLVPFYLSQLEEDVLAELKKKSFSENVAQILNMFFSCHLNSWDVEFSVGRYPYRIEELNQRIIVAELWHNIQDSYKHFVQSIYEKISAERTQKEPPVWVQIAVEIAVLFGLCSELQKRGIESFDIAVDATDFLYPISAWYARRMGLPVNCIICGCENDSGIWDFLQRGEFMVNSSEKKYGCLELLIYGTLGIEQTQVFVEACHLSKAYQLNTEELETLNQGYFAAVVGKKRIETVINSMYRTNNYVADPATAISCGALQDFRAQTGENRHTLLISRCNPMLHTNEITAAIGCSEDTLKTLIRRSGE